MELKVEEVDEVGTQNTAHAIRDIGCDVLLVVEAETRSALLRCSDNVLPALGGQRFHFGHAHRRALTRTGRVEQDRLHRPITGALRSRPSRAIFRKACGREERTALPALPEITKASEAASDHAAVLADIDV